MFPFADIVKSPKSEASPVEAIVITSILFVRLVASPAAINPFVALDAPACSLNVDVKSPKSVALPVAAIVIYCILFISYS